jgi:hypothetical protein
VDAEVRRRLPRVREAAALLRVTEGSRPLQTKQVSSDSSPFLEAILQTLD